MNNERKEELLNKVELTVSELMELWNVSAPTVIRYIKTGWVDGYDASEGVAKYAKWRIRINSVRARMKLPPLPDNKFQMSLPI